MFNTYFTKVSSEEFKKFKESLKIKEPVSIARKFSKVLPEK